MNSLNEVLVFGHPLPLVIIATLTIIVAIGLIVLIAVSMKDKENYKESMTPVEPLLEKKQEIKDDG